MLKIWRSAYSRFGVHVEFPDDLLDETITAEKSYTDEVLKEISDNGFNAVWVHGQLHHIIRHPRYPEFAPNSSRHLQSLKTLCARAERFGIKVCLYLQPPRAIPVNDKAFWEAHAEDGGQIVESYGDDGTSFQVRSLCTSLPGVRQYIRESFAELIHQLPELGGLIIISASEYPAHCYSCRNCKPGPIRPRKLVMDHIATNCPHCGKREPEEVVLELIHTIRDGVRSVSSDMNLIIWNWSWSMYIDPPCRSIIERLPKDIYLLLDFERGGYRKDGTFINEYSLGYSGPSEQFLETKSVSDRCGIPVLPKLQLGTTHELATVRNLPIIENLFYKAEYIRKNKLDGLMGCWNFGNLSSSSVKAFLYFLNLPDHISCSEALKMFARASYPGSDAEKISAAWKHFTEAMEFYPFTVPFLYVGPQNHSLALIPEKGPLSGKKVGRSFLPDERGDSYIDSETEEFPLDEIIRRFGIMAEIWEKGVALLRDAMPKDHVDFGNAVICGAVWKSVYNMFRIYRLRKQWCDAMSEEWLEIVNSELSVVEYVLPYVEADPQQGWHIEGDFYSFNAELIRKKIETLKSVL